MNESQFITVKVALVNKREVHGLLELHKQAAQEVYKPQGYTEEDSLHGLLFWHLAGFHVASIAHCSLGLPSVSILHHNTIMPPLVASFTYPTVLEVEVNILAWYKNIGKVTINHATIHQVEYDLGNVLGAWKCSKFELYIKRGGGNVAASN